MKARTVDQLWRNEARGARPIFLPAYSPDLNPIEQLFARLKSFAAQSSGWMLYAPAMLAGMGGRGFRSSPVACRGGDARFRADGS
jgi:hypothetical protein